MSSPLTPAWTAPRTISRADKTDEAALATEVEEARQRALRMSRRLTQGRKSTIGLECAPRSLRDRAPLTHAAG